MSLIDGLSETEVSPSGRPRSFDLVFDMTEADGSVDGRFRIAGECRLRDRRAAFAFDVLQATWEPRQHGDDVFHWGYMGLRFEAAESSPIVDFLEDIAAAGPAERRSFAVLCYAVALEGDPRRPADRPIRTKLFFQPVEVRGMSQEESDAIYAEVFLSWHVDSRRVWIVEKDPDYRLPLLAWLRGERGSDATGRPRVTP